MRLKQNGIILVLVVALVGVAIGIVRTDQHPTVAATTTRRSPLDRSFTVDQTSLVTAEQLVRLPTTPEERTYAQDALRIADQEMDLAFAQAVRRASNQQALKSPEITQLNDQLQQALRALANDQAQVAELTAAVAKAGPATLQSLTDRLELTKAQVALDQDEVDDARQDLQRVGGDPQGRIQAIVAEHEAASKSSDSMRVVVTRPPERHGMVQYVDAYLTLRDKERQLNGAKDAAEGFATNFRQAHDRMEARAARVADSIRSTITHDSSAVLLQLTRRRALSEKLRATLDQRVDNQHRLADTYASWAGVVRSQARGMVNEMLRSIGWIIVIVLLGVLLTRWIGHIVNAPSADHRRAQTLYMISRASIQVLCVVLVLLVIFGAPNDVGTLLGLAGAGLTVALKDFIVGFLGWFVLMGKNGIRVGDLVEINGVTGEVIEIGMFYTMLLETGAWSESHPTGRRATFNNSFAIEGHYFNFSTSGRWMWDEVRIDVPAGRDPQPIVEAFDAEIRAATAESARLAEQEWKAARRSPHAETIAAAPSITLRPSGGGVEIIARYITQAAERDALRAKLYQTAIGLLGESRVEPHLPARAPTAVAR